MAENIRIKELLNEMSTMLTMSLLETGKALKSMDMRTTGKIITSSTHPRLRSTIPAAMEKYHGALDELESEIVRVSNLDIQCILMELAASVVCV